MSSTQNLPKGKERKPPKNSISPNTTTSKTIWKMSDNGIRPPKKFSRLCLPLPFRIINSNWNFYLKTLRRQSWMPNQSLKVSLKDHLFTDTLLTPHLALDLYHKLPAEFQDIHTLLLRSLVTTNMFWAWITFPLLCKHLGQSNFTDIQQLCESQNISPPDYTTLLLAADNTGFICWSDCRCLWKNRLLVY